MKTSKTSTLVFVCAVAALAAGFVGGALVGWLCTAGTRAAMSNWGLPACFSLPLVICLEGALGAVVFALLVAVPASLRLSSPSRDGLSTN